MKLKFIKDGFVDGQLVFEKGKVYDISDEKGSASRWIKRGIVVEVKDVVVKEEPKAEPKKEVIAEEDSGIFDSPVKDKEKSPKKEKSKK